MPWTGKYKKITIIGVGLIGGSIGLAVKGKGLAQEVAGVTAHGLTLRKALERRAIDRGYLDAKKAVAGSDMVILATPVDKILSTLRLVAPCLSKGCMVIDVASVKAGIVRPAERILPPGVSFVGTHPMAGSEQRGIDKAGRYLFKDATCILTKTEKTDAKALVVAAKFWRALGSKTYVLSPEEHDRIISKVSHLPHAAAFALCAATEKGLLKFASTGFRDTTRIASSDPSLWASIFMENRRNLADDIDNYSRKLQMIKNLVMRGEKNRLKGILIQAKVKRDKL